MLMINRLFTGTLWHKRSRSGLCDDEMGGIQPKWQFMNATRQCYRKLWVRQWERGEAAVGDFGRTELAGLGRDGVLPIGGERKVQSCSWMRWRLFLCMRMAGCRGGLREREQDEAVMLNVNVIQLA
jgi:hypothetical protein